MEVLDASPVGPGVFSAIASICHNLLKKSSGTANLNGIFWFRKLFANSYYGPFGLPYLALVSFACIHALQLLWLGKDHLWGESDGCKWTSFGRLSWPKVDCPFAILIQFVIFEEIMHKLHYCALSPSPTFCWKNFWPQQNGSSKFCYWAGIWHNLHEVPGSKIVSPLHTVRSSWLHLTTSFEWVKTINGQVGQTSNCKTLPKVVVHMQCIHVYTCNWLRNVYPRADADNDKSLWSEVQNPHTNGMISALHTPLMMQLIWFHASMSQLQSVAFPDDQVRAPD